MELSPSLRLVGPGQLCRSDVVETAEGTPAGLLGCNQTYVAPADDPCDASLTEGGTCRYLP